MRAKFKIETPEPKEKPSETVASIYAPEKKRPAGKKLSIPRIPRQSVMLGVAIVCLGIPSILGIRRLFTPGKQPSNAETAIKPTLSVNDTKKLVEKVGKHMILPDELPQIVAITNSDTLKTKQAFFTLAKNGDQLLVYPTKVILYRPETDQIVDIAQIRLSPAPVASGSASEAP